MTQQALDQLIAQLIPTLFAILTTIIGGIFGFLLSEISTQRRERRTERRQAASVRALLAMEIERNLEQLRGFWAEVKQKDNPEAAPERRSETLARQLVETPLPPFSREGLNSQLSMVALLLPQADMINTFTFYDGLARLETVRREFSAALDEQEREMSLFRQSQSQSVPGQPRLVYGPRQPLFAKSNQQWESVEHLVSDLLQRGNPLAAARR
jgi:hypothetical protein